MGKINLPNEIFGRPVKGAMERVLANSDPQPVVQGTNQISNSVTLDPDMQKRVLRAWQRNGLKPGQFVALYDVQGRPVQGMYGDQAVISCFELPDMNNMNYENTHKKLFTGTEFYMPDPFIMMNFFKGVIEAQQGGRQLFHPDGSTVNKKLVEEMYKHLTTNYKDVYGSNNPGAWAWLNAGFPEVKIDKGQGTISGKIERVVGLNTDGTLKKDSRDLEQCLIEDRYADFDFNSQGLLIKPNGNSYEQGKNVYFWYPRQGSVARFYADSFRASLNCDRDPGNSDSGLGVFGCAEGADRARV